MITAYTFIRLVYLTQLCTANSMRRTRISGTDCVTPTKEAQQAPGRSGRRQHTPFNVNEHLGQFIFNSQGVQKTAPQPGVDPLP